MDLIAHIVRTTFLYQFIIFRFAVKLDTSNFQNRLLSGLFSSILNEVLIQILTQLFKIGWDGVYGRREKKIQA